MNTNELEFEPKAVEERPKDNNYHAEYTVTTCDICHSKINSQYHVAKITFNNPELLGGLRSDYALCRECSNALALWVYPRLGLFNQK